MQVKHNTYHWVMQWSYMVMQVKKGMSQRLGSVGIAQTYNIDYTLIINSLLNECYTPLHS